MINIITTAVLNILFQPRESEGIGKHIYTLIITITPVYYIIVGVK